MNGERKQGAATEETPVDVPPPAHAVAAHGGSNPEVVR
jgi:hypothetical protein